MASRLVHLGYHLSFAGNVTYKGARKLREVAEWVPMERLLLETDSPFLPPVPRRPGRNEPAWVRFTAEAVAKWRGIPVEELGEATLRNASELFGLDEEEESA